MYSWPPFRVSVFREMSAGEKKNMFPKKIKVQLNIFLSVSNHSLDDRYLHSSTELFYMKCRLQLDKRIFLSNIFKWILPFTQEYENSQATYILYLSMRFSNFLWSTLMQIGKLNVLILKYYILCFIYLLNC